VRATRTAAAQSAPETGQELLARILTERRKAWKGRGEYKEPTAPTPPDVELPPGWVWTGLDQLSDGTKNAIKAGPFGSSLKKSVYRPSGFKIYGQEQVIRGDAHWGDYFISRELFDHLQSCQVKPGDILISLVGTTGKVLILPDDCAPGIINPRLLKLSLNHSGVEPRFIKNLLESPSTRAFFKLAAHGGTMEILNLGILKTLPIPLPPLSEQRRIVAEIEKQFTRLEAGVAALRRVQANLRRYRAAVLKAACEGRLVPTEAELARTGKRKSTFETGEALLARILTDRRKNWQGRGKYKEPLAPNANDLPQLSPGWTWSTAEQLTLLVTSGSRGWGEFYSDEGPLFIRAQDIKTDSLKLAGIARVALPEKAEGMRSSVENCDLLVTITGANVTKSAIVRGLSEVAFVSQHVALLKLVCRETSPFLFLWIVSPAHGRKSLERWAYGAGKPGLSLEQVRGLPIPLPPLAEQTRIVAEVERRLSVVEELEAVVSANLQRATRLRQSILQKAFTGELV
jgi:type I restriction enzyme S subunit